MEFNVAQLMKEATGASREFALGDDLTGLDAGLTPLSHLTGSLELLRIHSGVLATANFQVTLALQCGRCLEPVAFPVEVHFVESFRPLTDVESGRFLLPEEYEGQAEDLTDEALLINAQHILNISEVVRQNIWLAIPIVAGCDYVGPTGGAPNREDCPNYRKLLSESTLAEENGTTSRAEAAGIDPRWEALLSLQNEPPAD